jgi:hypothetical protein
LCAGVEGALNVPSNPQTDSIDRRQIGALLRVPWQRANLAVNRALRAAGHEAIQPAHQLVFQHLPATGATRTDLARLAQIPEPMLFELVAELVAHGYLTCDATDGVVRREARGWEVERVARETIQRLEDEWGERMGLERFADLCALLAYLAAVSNDDTQIAPT